MISTSEAWPLARWKRGTTRFAGMHGLHGMACQTRRDKRAQLCTGAQCTLMPRSYTGTRPICISRVTGGSQQQKLLEAEMSQT